jgi:NADH-quinone oxidoreductase subunit J
VVDLLFYVAALVAVLTAGGVVLARNPVVSVVSLLTCFGSLAVIYLLAGFQFLAAIQILVYGGAIMVLFLFVVMLLNLGGLSPEAEDRDDPLFHDRRRSAGGLAVAVALGSASLIGILRGARHLAEPTNGFVLPDEGYDALPALAEAMFTRYSLPFEAASVLLLATTVGVMVLAKRQRSVPPAGEKRP